MGKTFVAIGGFELFKVGRALRRRLTKLGASMFVHPAVASKMLSKDPVTQRMGISIRYEDTQ